MINFRKLEDVKRSVNQNASPIAKQRALEDMATQISRNENTIAQIRKALVSEDHKAENYDRTI